MISTPALLVVSPETSIRAALVGLGRVGIDALPVMDGGAFAGLLDPARGGRRHPGPRGPRGRRAVVSGTAAGPGLLSVETARDAVLAAARPTGTETVEIDVALGRVVAETAVARTSLPPWENSAMDGYAIQAADTDVGLRRVGRASGSR